MAQGVVDDAPRGTDPGHRVVAALVAGGEEDVGVGLEHQVAVLLVIDHHRLQHATCPGHPLSHPVQHPVMRHDQVGVPGDQQPGDVDTALGQAVLLAITSGIAVGLLMVIAGYEAAHPDEADPALVLSAEGQTALDTVDDGCVTDILARFEGTVGGPFLQPDAGTVEPWATLMATNDPGQTKIRAPVLVTGSSADEVVPGPLVDALVDRMCAAGSRVERRLYDDGGGHLETALRSYLEGFAWLDERFARQRALSACA